MEDRYEKGMSILRITNEDTIEEIFKECLPKYWRPKRVVVVDNLPLTENGKPRRNVIP